MKIIDKIFYFIVINLVMIACGPQKVKTVSNEKTLIRFATFNTAMFRDQEKGLLKELMDTNSIQAKNVAAIIQKINPDVLALQEFDYDKSGHGLKLFMENYLEIGQYGFDPIYFEYYWSVPSNTGIPSGVDFNNNGSIDDPNDAFGFGRFPGQYAYAILSKYPFDPDSIRTFQKFLWKDMRNANLPVDPETNQFYYSPEAMDIFRLSSKNHIDVPIETPGRTVHVIIAHPTPPVFDGAEDRNGLRNHDEIRLIADYISETDISSYIYDDKGKYGGLGQDASFVIMGDMNADPADGDSYNNAILQLLTHTRYLDDLNSDNFIPESKGSKENTEKTPDRNNSGPKGGDTSVWGLRIDYVIPSNDLKPTGGGVFWPSVSSPYYYLVKDNASSDHFLTWLDLEI